MPAPCSSSISVTYGAISSSLSRSSAGPHHSLNFLMHWALAPGLSAAGGPTGNSTVTITLLLALRPRHGQHGAGHRAASRKVVKKS